MVRVIICNSHKLVRQVNQDRINSHFSDEEVPFQELGASCKRKIQIQIFWLQTYFSLYDSRKMYVYKLKMFFIHFKDHCVH